MPKAEIASGNMKNGLALLEEMSINAFLLSNQTRGPYRAIDNIRLLGISPETIKSSWYFSERLRTEYTSQSYYNMIFIMTLGLLSLAALPVILIIYNVINAIILIIWLICWLVLVIVHTKVQSRGFRTNVANNTYKALKSAVTIDLLIYRNCSTEFQINRFIDLLSTLATLTVYDGRLENLQRYLDKNYPETQLHTLKETLSQKSERWSNVDGVQREVCEAMIENLKLEIEKLENQGVQLDKTISGWVCKLGALKIDFQFLIKRIQNIKTEVRISSTAPIAENTVLRTVMANIFDQFDALATEFLELRNEIREMAEQG